MFSPESWCPMNSKAIFALVLALAGWASYVPLAKHATLRASMWPMFLILGVALCLGISALFRDDKPAWPTRIVAGLAVLFAVLLAPAYFLMLRVPQSSGRPQVGQTLPEVNVVNERGERISSAGFAGDSPLLIVFFRGFW